MVTAAKNRQRTDHNVRFARLGEQDARDVLTLYSDVFLRAPDGFLAQRDAAEMRGILADPRTGLGIGARSANTGQLVAYTLCQPAPDATYENAPLVSGLGRSLWAGRGTVVDPAWEGRLLMSRLLAERAAHLKSMDVHHTAGLVAVENVTSLAAALRAGGRVVGLERDESCLNFVVYGGPLVRGRTIIEETHVDVSDTHTMGRLIADGLIGSALVRGANGRRRLTFGRLGP